LLAGVDLGKPTNPKVRYEHDSDHDTDPFDFGRFKALLREVPVPYRRDTFDAQWVRCEHQYLIGAAGDDSRPLYTLKSSPAFSAWGDAFREIFVRNQPCLELFLLLPRQVMNRLQWEALKPDVPLSGRTNALRLLSGLSVLGYMTDHSRDRRRLLPKLVVASRELFEQLVVVGADAEDLPDDEVLREQMEGLVKGVMLIRPKVSRFSNAPPWVEPFAVDFSKLWYRKKNQFGSWFVHPRAGDVDEAADAWLLLMSQTSGVCVHLSLSSRRDKSPLKK
jgi:hypothetical protein